MESLGFGRGMKDRSGKSGSTSTNLLKPQGLDLELVLVPALVEAD